MKVLVLTIALLLARGAYAEEAKPTSADSAVNAMTGKEKQSRKKKAVMCAECGKPESECECKGEKHDKQDKQGKAVKDANKEGDGPAH